MERQEDRQQTGRWTDGRKERNKGKMDGWTERKRGMDNSTGKREDLIGGWRKQNNRDL